MNKRMTAGFISWVENRHKYLLVVVESVVEKNTTFQAIGPLSSEKKEDSASRTAFKNR